MNSISQHPTIAAAAREDFADELRGFALLGIVLVNAPFLGISWQGFTQTSISSWFDQAAAFAVVALAQAKFYLLFAFLFGYSLNFILKDAQPSQQTRYMRRLLLLAIFGALHAVLFFVSDILMVYAFIGISMLWLHKKSDQFVLKFAAWVLAAWGILLISVVVLAWIEPAAMVQPQDHVKQVNAVFATDSFLQVMQARLSILPTMQSMTLTLNGLAVLAMFCIGWVAGRGKLLSNVQQHLPLWRTGSLVGWILGLPVALTAAWLAVGPEANVDQPGLRETLGAVLGFLGAPLLALGYVSWLALHKIRWPNGLAWFRRSGRMSLTGYIGESVVLSLFFCGYGLSYFAQLGAAKVAFVALGVWFALDIFALLWMHFFKQGPLESALKFWLK